MFNLPIELQLKIFEYDNTYKNAYYYVMDSLMDLVWLIIENFKKKKHFNIRLYNYYKRNRDILLYVNDDDYESTD